MLMSDKREEVKNVMREELEKLKRRIVENHIRAGQRASGRTIASMRVEVDDEAGILFGRQAFATLEFGRKPGKVPKGFYQIIQQWVIDKGIQVEKPKSFAYLVARKIANEGTELYRKGGIDDIYSPDIKETIEMIMNRVFGIFAEDVSTINLHSNENS